MAREPVFRDPAHGEALSLPLYLRSTPGHAVTRGFYFNELVRIATAAGHGRPDDLFVGLSQRTFIPIFNYSLREYMTLLANVSRLVYPDATLREGVRKLGHRMYVAFEQSPVGPPTTRAADMTLDAVFRVASTIIKVSVTPGSVRAVRMGERHWQAHYDDIFCFLDAFHVGVVEGVILRFRAVPDVRVALTSRTSGTFDVRWR